MALVAVLAGAVLALEPHGVEEAAQRLAAKAQRLQEAKALAGGMREDAGAACGFTASQQQCLAAYETRVNAVAPGLLPPFASRRWGGKDCRAGRGTPAVINAGFGTTATTEVAELFDQQFQRKVHHWAMGNQEPADFWPRLVGLLRTKGRSPAQCAEALNDLDFGKAFTVGFDYLSDLPVPELFLDFYAASPSSKVVLSNRETKSWVTSRLKHHAHGSPAPVGACGTSMREYEKAAGALFEAHAEMVRCVVPPENLLEFDLFATPRGAEQDKLVSQLADFVGLYKPLHNLTMPTRKSLVETDVDVDEEEDADEDEDEDWEDILDEEDDSPLMDEDDEDEEDEEDRGSS